MTESTFSTKQRMFKAKILPKLKFKTSSARDPHDIFRVYHAIKPQCWTKLGHIDQGNNKHGKITHGKITQQDDPWYNSPVSDYIGKDYPRKNYPE